VYYKIISRLQTPKFRSSSPREFCQRSTRTHIALYVCGDLQQMLVCVCVVCAQYMKHAERRKFNKCMCMCACMWFVSWFLFSRNKYMYLHSGMPPIAPMFESCFVCSKQAKEIISCWSAFNLAWGVSWHCSSGMFILLHAHHGHSQNHDLLLMKI
jgi:hypothetical protein